MLIEVHHRFESHQPKARSTIFNFFLPWAGFGLSVLSPLPCFLSYHASANLLFANYNQKLRSLKFHCWANDTNFYCPKGCRVNFNHSFQKHNFQSFKHNTIFFPFPQIMSVFGLSVRSLIIQGGLMSALGSHQIFCVMILQMSHLISFKNLILMLQVQTCFILMIMK